MNLKGAQPERFGGIAAFFYRRWAEPMLAPMHRRIGAEVPLEEGRLLDIGCGPGRLDRLIAAALPGLHVVGLDESQDMLRQAARGPNPPNLEFRLGRLEETDFREEFDFAVSVLSFHHWEEPERGLEAAYRALKPGGSLWIYEQDPEASGAQLRRDFAPLWGWLRTPAWLKRRMARDHGFSAREIEEVVRPAVSRTSFRNLELTPTGATFRLSLVRGRGRRLDFRTTGV